MKTELLKILRESDGYVSGQQLCERFHVSRTAVWKVIQQLKEEGYEVEAVKKQRIPDRDHTRRDYRRRDQQSSAYELDG